MSIFYVYEVWDCENNLPFYVGKCADIDERMNQHIKEMTRKANATAFHKKLRQMIAGGRKYEVREAFRTSEEKEALAAEVQIIATYGRRQHGGCLLNLTDGGEGTSGHIPTEATRLLWSQQRQGKIPANKNTHYTFSKPTVRKGKPWTAEQRQRFDSRTPEEIDRKRQRSSLAHKGQQQSAEWRAEHSARMSGSGNPMFGKQGYFAGKIGPWAGKSHPNKGRKKGPDGKLYFPEDLLFKFGIQ